MTGDSRNKLRFSFSNRLTRSLLVFGGLFVLFAFVQFEIFTHQQRAAGREKLERWADEISKELKYSNTKWELASFRNADYDAIHYYVLDNDGLIIVVGGFEPDLQFRVALKGLVPGLQTVTVPETGESWRLLIKPVQDGFVLLGVTPPENITDVDARLERNAGRFRATLAEALQVKIHDIDKELDFAIIDATGLVRYFDGAIPLQVTHRNFTANEMDGMKTDAGATYGVLSEPFRDSAGREVGSITVFDELAPPPWKSPKIWTTNLLGSATLSLIGMFISGPFLRQSFQPKKLLEAALKSGECTTVEFKEGLRWDQWPGGQDAVGSGSDAARKKNLAEGIAIKNIAAFLNNLDGGTLFIGIADDKRIVGLERDYQSFVRPGQERQGLEKDRDVFQRHLRSILTSKIAREFVQHNVEIGIISTEDKDICVIHANPSLLPVYISEEKGRAFYVRDGASTISLDVEQTVSYNERRWPKGLWPRLWSRVA